MCSNATATLSKKVSSNSYMAWLDFIKKYTLVKTQKQMPTPANKFILKVIIE
jgi:hypothetical protein